MATNDLEIRLKLIDETGPVLRTFIATHTKGLKDIEVANARWAQQGQLSLREADRSYTTATKSVSTLSKVVDVSTRTMGQKMQGAGNQMFMIGRRLGFVTAAITGGVVAAVRSMISFGEAMYNLHERTGIGVETLSSFKLATDSTNTSMGSLAKGMRVMGQEMVKADKGNKTAIALFDDLGVKVVDSSGKLRDQTDVFMDVAQKFSLMEDGAEKSALAVQLFKRSGVELLPLLSLGKKGLEDQAAAAKKFGIVMSEETAKAADVLSKKVVLLGAASKGMYMTIAAIAVPVITKITLWATKIADKVRLWVEAHRPLVKVLTEVGVKLILFLGFITPILMTVGRLTSMLGLLSKAFLGIGGATKGLASVASGAGAVARGISGAVNSFKGFKTAIIAANWALNEETGKLVFVNNGLGKVKTALGLVKTGLNALPLAAKAGLVALAAYGGYKFGELIGQIQIGKKTLSEWVYGWTTFGQVMDLQLKKLDMELTAATATMKAHKKIAEDTLVKGYAFASEQAGKSIKTVAGVVGTLGLKFIETGTSGSSITDKWIKNWIITEAKIGGTKITMATFAEDMARYKKDFPATYTALLKKMGELDQATKNNTLNMKDFADEAKKALRDAGLVSITHPGTTPGPGGTKVLNQSLMEKQLQNQLLTLQQTRLDADEMGITDTTQFFKAMGKSIVSTTEAMVVMAKIFPTVRIDPKLLDMLEKAKLGAKESEAATATYSETMDGLGITLAAQRKQYAELSGAKKLTAEQDKAFIILMNDTAVSMGGVVTAQQAWRLLQKEGILTKKEEGKEIATLNTEVGVLDAKYKASTISVTQYTKGHESLGGKLKELGETITPIAYDMNQYTLKLKDQEAQLAATQSEYNFYQKALLDQPGNLQFKKGLDEARDAMERQRFEYGMLTGAAKAWARMGAEMNIDKQKQEMVDLTGDIIANREAYAASGGKIDAYRIKAEELQATLDALGLKWTEMTEDQRNLTKATLEAESGIKEQKDSIQGYENTITALNLRLAQGTISHKTWAKGVNEAADAVNEASPGLAKYNMNLDAVRQRLDVVSKTDAQAKLNQMVADFTLLAVAAGNDKAELEKLQPVISNIGDLMVQLGIKKPKLKLAELMAEESVKTIAQIKKIYDVWAAVNLAMGIRVPLFKMPALDESSAKKLIKKVGETSTKAVQGFKAGFSTLGMLFGQLASKMAESFGETPTAAQKAGVQIVAALGSASENITSYFTGLKNMSEVTWAGIAEAVTPAIGSIGAALGGLVSNTKDNFGQMGSDIGQTVGGMLGPIGGLIGGFVGGVLGGLFKKSKTQMEKWADDGIAAFKKLGDGTKKISEELAKKFAELRKTGMAATAAEATLLSEAMTEMGVTTKNIEKYWGESLNAIYQVTAGLLTQDQAAEALGKDWDVLIAKAIEFGTEGSAGMTNFIRQTQAAGLEVKSMTDYINAQLGVVKQGAANAAEGLLAMANAIAPQMADLISQLETATGAEATKIKEQLKAMGGPEVTASLKNLENQTLSVFNAMVANGVSMADAMASLGPTLDALAAKEKALGIEAGDSIKSLLHINAVTKANKGLFDAVSGNLAVLTALGNTGALTQQAFQDSANATANYYKQLQAKGLSSKESLSAIAPTLEKLRYLAKEQGLALDENTKKLIAEAEASGVLKAEALDTNTVMMAGFGEIIKALGGQIPAAFQKAMDSMNRTSSATAPGVGAPIEKMLVDVSGGIKKGLDDKLKESLGVMKKTGAGAAPAMGAPIATVIIDMKTKLGELDTALLGTYDNMKTIGDDAKVNMSGPVVGAIDDMETRLERFRKLVTTGEWSIPITAADYAASGGRKSPADKHATGFEGYLPRNKTFTAHAGEYMKIWPASQVSSGKPVSADGSINVTIQPVVIPKENATIIDFVISKIERGDVIVPPRAVRGRA